MDTERIVGDKKFSFSFNFKSSKMGNDNLHNLHLNVNPPEQGVGLRINLPATRNHRTFSSLVKSAALVLKIICILVNLCSKSFVCTAAEIMSCEDLM